MDLNECASKFGVKAKTVEGWIKKGYIPGAKQVSDGEWDIPCNSRRPYTEHRINKNSSATSIYKSILKGCDKRCHVSAIIYDLKENDFNNYIEVLISKSFIKKINESGIINYNITIDGSNYIKNPFKFCVDIGLFNITIGN